MAHRFLGIDFGWQGKPSGLACLGWDGSALRLLHLSIETTMPAILAWADKWSLANTGIGIDAPTVIPNATGMRPVDKLTHAHYGRYHAGCYPANRSRPFWERTTGLSEAFLTRGFAHGDQLRAKSKGRFQIEVHPHAAVVQLHALPRILKYKRGSLAERRAGLAQLRDLMLSRFPLLDPPLPLELPPIPDSGPALKNLEDRLDSITCAYVAAHYWRWGSQRNDVLGDALSGYIVVPKRTSEPK